MVSYDASLFAIPYISQETPNGSYSQKEIAYFLAESAEYRKKALPLQRNAASQKKGRNENKKNHPIFASKMRQMLVTN